MDRYSLAVTHNHLLPHIPLENINVSAKGKKINRKKHLQDKRKNDIDDTMVARAADFTIVNDIECLKGTIITQLLEGQISLKSVTG